MLRSFYGPCFDRLPDHYWEHCLVIFWNYFWIVFLLFSDCSDMKNLKNLKNRKIIQK